MDHIDLIVVGAGVVGLAIAKAFVERGFSVIVLEEASAVGSATSSRNSEVIHAGIYYPSGSLKAQLCVEGRRLLYAYCRAHNIPHARTAKLIVATTEAEISILERLQQTALANDLTSTEEALQLWSAQQVRHLEPAVSCVAALYSPATGIVDSHSLLQALLGDLENGGGAVVCNTQFMAAERQSEHFIVTTAAAGETFRLASTFLINAAGLQAQAVARMMDGVPSESIPEPLWVKGCYFGLSGAQPQFRTLVYPVPNSLGLGVHLTLDLAGRVRFGPDAERVTTLDYTVDPGRADTFYSAIRRYWPGLPDDCLVPEYAGIRPKLRASEQGFADFVIDGPQEHGVPGLVNLFGIESPGLTASLAIAAWVRSRLEGSW